MDGPFTNGGNGETERDGSGRFLPGNKAATGRGNPHARNVNAWRNALVECVSADDLRDVIAKLVDRAKAGERWAVCELLDRCLGKVTQVEHPAEEFQSGELVVKLEFDEPPARDPPTSPELVPTIHAAHRCFE